MAVSMTLNQLYAPSSSASNVGAVLTKDRTHASHPLQHMDRIYQMPFPNQYTLQYPSSSSTMHFHSLSKSGLSISDDYAADPLPFEYSRKFSPSHRDDVTTGLRGSVSNATSSALMHFDSYGTHSIYTQPTATQRLNSYSQSHYPESRGYHSSEITAQSSFPRTPMYHPMASLSNHLPSHSMNTKKEVDVYTSPQTSVYGDTQNSVGTVQEAMIKVKTPLKLKYWRNGRRNLQCFPSCKVFGDYSAIKIEDLKQHDFMWGKCRGSLVTEVTLNSNMTFDDLILLGRVHSLENIPIAFEEAVIRECMLGRTVESEEIEMMKDQWITGERFPNFVQQEGNVACFEFKPKVWKYNEDMAQGKCKRRNVKYYVQFEAFVQMVSGDRRYYACIGSGMSTSFEVGSSRVLARQKRKAAFCGSDETKDIPESEMTSIQCGQSQSMMTHNANPLISNVMATHPMYSHQSTFHHDNPSRGLPLTFPHPQITMNSMPQMSSEIQYSLPQQQVNASQSLIGIKRKMNSERPAFPTEHSVKMFKTASGIPQSVPI
ncbi:uncharacterized protein PHALS_10781 [Plasmopara halstedii]|uniref:Uncharacterized protein n=1 Tax=Plasmopara halstedii TaxID=4781 RepID=A0A0P1AHJ5_PLAHL|nr:uncharacterized protein PHALS_10781 [Plasmopara halstedii]CEG40593.1 hypothetical protein PHALS_10781 [Plasmopara halstedii]|eukprot:XP_024576962.1 hypothetical protein PHALS_10781 [Plasmopara halstedii]